MMETEVTANVPMLTEGREVATLAAMAATARAASAPARPEEVVIEKVKDIARRLAQSSEDGKAARYAFPMGGETVSGLAAPLAQALAMECGNCLLATALEKETDDAFYVSGIALRTDTGAFMVKSYRQPKAPPGGRFQDDEWVSKSGRGRVAKDRALAQTYGIGGSKALRNAIKAVWPFHCQIALEEAEKGIADARRKGRDGRAEGPSAKDWKAQYARAGKAGFTKEQVEQFLGEKRENTFENFDRLRDMLAAVEAKELTIEEALGQVEDLATGAKEA